MKLNLSKKAIALATAGILACGGAVGAVAYYSGTADTVNNTFNIVAGEQDAEDAGTIEEPSWDEEDAKDLQPNQTVAKDPTLVSNADYDAWAFIKVEIPTIEAQKYGDSVDKVYDAVELGTIDSGWELVSSTVSTTAGTNSVYIYGYSTILEAGDSTTALFSDFTVPDFTRADATSGSIDVSAEMIQTVGYDTLADAATALGLN